MKTYPSWFFFLFWWWLLGSKVSVGVVDERSVSVTPWERLKLRERERQRERGEKEGRRITRFKVGILGELTLFLMRRCGHGVYSCSWSSCPPTRYMQDIIRYNHKATVHLLTYQELPAKVGAHWNRDKQGLECRAESNENAGTVWYSDLLLSSRFARQSEHVALQLLSAHSK